MDTATLIAQIQGLLKQVPDIRKERQAIGSPKVKAWKTEVEQSLRLGGKNLAKTLQNFQALKFGAGAMGSDAVGSSEVKFQAYQAEMDAAEKLLKNGIQTLQIFGVSEEAKLPDWFKQELKASGTIRVGSKEVDIRTVTIGEFLAAIVLLAEGDKSLDESLKEELRSKIQAMKKHPLLQPFLNQTIDKPFSKL